MPSNIHYGATVNRPKSIGAVVTMLALCIAVVACSAFAKGPLAAKFVVHDQPNEVDMINLIESPPGRLSGSLVISSLNRDGSRKKDVVLDVNGTITGSNISLQLTGGPTGLTQLFGVSTNLVGTLSNGTLTLSRGNDTIQLQEMSQKNYQGALENLDVQGSHIAAVANAKTAIQDASSNGQKLNGDLKSYIDWGQQRIDHVPNLSLWFQKRIEAYSQCLRRIRPLAAAHVPEWRWQECVINVENDKFTREDLERKVHSYQLQNQQEIAQLNTRIVTSQQKFASAINLLQSSCPYTTDSGRCQRAVQKLKTLWPYGFLNAELIGQFHKTVPMVTDALSKDLNTANQGENSLVSLSQQIVRLYQSAH